MPTALSIRPVLPSEAETLLSISRDTFIETFGLQNTSEDMRQYVARTFTLNQVQAQLKDANVHLFFAEREGNIIGYLKLNTGPAQTEALFQDALEIERIYVLSQFHGRNVGQQLLQKAIGVAKNQGFKLIWLGVWEENPRAIKFYQKHGFVEFDTHVFKLGEDVQTDLLMKLELTPSPNH